MTERDLEVGSASPPTADVPNLERLSPNRWLDQPEFAEVRGHARDGWTHAEWQDQAPLTRLEFEARLGVLRGALRAPERVPPTPIHAATPETPGAATVAGGVTVPDEAVEAGVRAALDYWDRYGIEVAQTLLVRREIEAALPAAAPLIVEHYLRQQIRAHSVEPTPEVVWEQVRQMARSAALRTAMSDALRAAANVLDELARQHPDGGVRDGYSESAAVVRGLATAELSKEITDV